MRAVCVLALFLLTGLCAPAQDLTTFVLVRHAEKELEGKDPGLTAAGQARANRLAEILSKEKIAALFSSNYQRTRSTLAPLAAQTGLTISLYDPGNVLEGDRILKEFTGKTVVVSGHSNTIPRLANFLLGKDEVADFTDNEYSHILVITVTADRKYARLVRLEY